MSLSDFLSDLQNDANVLLHSFDGARGVAGIRTLYRSRDCVRVCVSVYVTSIFCICIVFVFVWASFVLLVNCPFCFHRTARIAISVGRVLVRLRTHGGA
jgi:hypothetical protein